MTGNFLRCFGDASAVASPSAVMAVVEEDDDDDDDNNNDDDDDRNRASNCETMFRNWHANSEHTGEIIASSVSLAKNGSGVLEAIAPSTTDLNCL